ncbi:MAG: sensor histidine kinase KdpD, partial [Cyanobacteria bacterium SZAS TMP-1]|nr:sensor histidine kinase KdpD [Cyanobacteria bacterium SZAS TMP-1]
AQITKVGIRERVPDYLLEHAQKIELVDLPPDELLERLKAGNVYMPEQAKSAMENFFRKGNLIALRELALRYTAERVGAEMEEYRSVHEIKHPWPASERLLVCISGSPHASRLVRAGKRMAEALRAKWTVLYVESPGPYVTSTATSAESRNRVVQTLRLAEQLGADTLELSGGNAQEEIINFARQYNASKIIIGKPAKPRWKERLFGSLVEDVIRQSGVIDVYVISGDEGGDLPSQVSQLTATSKSSAYFGAVAIVLLCTVIAKTLPIDFAPANVVMMYLLGVVVVASRYGRGPSILVSVLSVAFFDFFCVPPYYTFAVSDVQYVVTFIVMLVVALTISSLTVISKQQAEAARLRETRTAALYSMSRDLSSTLDLDSLVAIGLTHIGSIFQSQVAILLVDDDGKLALSAVGEGEFALAENAVDIGTAGWVHQNKQAAGLGTDTLPGAGELYLPLLGAQKNLGVLAVRPSVENRFISPEQLRLLETFANQLALACERAKLSDDSEHARLQVKVEQLRSSLLSSVSHDLRTPLATIAGVASSIIEASEALDVQQCKKMAGEIYQESMRLNRLVSNLLDMTKLQSGTLKLEREAQPVEEVVGAALSLLEERLADWPVKTHVPEDLPYISVDEILIQQVLVNLLENAAKYSPSGSPIEIAAEATAEGVIVSVADRGPGVASEDKKRIFEMFYRGSFGEQTRATGAGLGLAICGGIIEAHGGRIWVEDRPEGGSVFKFLVPSVESPEQNV